MFGGILVVVDFAIHFHNGSFALDGVFVHAFLFKFGFVKPVHNAGNRYRYPVKFIHIDFLFI